MRTDHALRAAADPEARFDRRAWLTLAVVVVLLGFGLAVLVYRFSLPADGWKAYFTGDTDTFVYVENLMGAASGLRPGDVVAAVAGFRTTDVVPPAQLRAAWQAGATLTYTVVRDGADVPVPVTLTHWRFGAWLLATLRDLGQLANLLATYLLLGISAFVFWRRPGHPAAGAFLLLTSTLTTSNLLSGTLTSAWPELIDPAMILINGQVGNTFLYGALMPFVLVRFALVFPRPKPIVQRHPWLAATPALIGLALSLIPGNGPWGWFWFVASLLLMVLILTHTAFTARDAVSRAQVLWGLSGLIFGFGLLAAMLVGSTFGLLGAFSQTAFDVATALAFTVMGLTLAVAILRYRLFDIDILIRRTLVYAALTALLALVYFGSVVVLQGLLRGVTGGESPIAIVVSTLVIAALFGPVRSRVQRAIDRRFYRRKYDAARTLAAFAASARDETDLSRLNERLVNVVNETMQPQGVNLWLKH